MTWLILSQLPGFDAGMLSLVSNGATVAVLVWYVVYDIRVRTPAMLAAFTSEQDKQRMTFSHEQTVTHDHYNRILDGMRSTFASEQTLARSTFMSEQVAVRDRYDKELTSLREMLIDTLKGMRTAVHDVRDTAQTLMAKHELEETQK